MHSLLLLLLLPLPPLYPAFTDILNLTLTLIHAHTHIHNPQALAAQKALVRPLAAEGRVAWFGYLSSTGV